LRFASTVERIALAVELVAKGATGAEALKLRECLGSSQFSGGRSNHTEHGRLWRMRGRLYRPRRGHAPRYYLVRGRRVIDVYFYGRISELATRRDEFASIIASGRADAMIKRLDDRVQRLLGD